MRAILGPVAIKGLEGEGAINLDTLIEGDEDFGLLDGMIYGPVDAKTRVIVTTDGLLRRWLHQHKDWWGKDSPSLPQDPGAAVKVDAFYTQAVQNDAAIMRFAVLAIRKPAGAAFAFAMLAARSQSEVPAKADEIFIVTAQGGRVFIGYHERVRRGRADRGLRSDARRSRQKIRRGGRRSGVERGCAGKEIAGAERASRYGILALLR